MALAWLLHLDLFAYLILGIPLCLSFQIFIRRMPLSSCWVHDTTRIRLDWLGVLLTVAFMVVPVAKLVTYWPHSNWSFRLCLFSFIIGAAGVAFTLRHFTVAAARSLLLCLATAGVLGCAFMLWTGHLQHHALKLTFERAGFAVIQFLFLLPGQFVIEEVAFRGVFDSHIHHPKDSKPWLSALLLSAMWGWWHFPVIPASAFVRPFVQLTIVQVMIGVPLSLCWRRSGNLMVPAAVHALINAVRNTYVS